MERHPELEISIHTGEMEPVNGDSLSETTGVDKFILANLVEKMWERFREDLSSVLNFPLRTTAIKYASPSHKEGFAADYAYEKSFADKSYPIANDRDPIWFAQPMLLMRMAVFQFMQFNCLRIQHPSNDHKLIVVNVGVFIESNHFHCHIIKCKLLNKSDDDRHMATVNYLPYTRTGRGIPLFKRFKDNLKKIRFSKFGK